MTKKNYLFNIDVTNPNGALVKNHGSLIKKGSVLELEESDRLKHFLKTGVVEIAGKVAEEKTPDPDAELKAILDNNANDAIDIINDGELSEDQLIKLLELENAKGSKARKTVIEEITSEIEDLKEQQTPDQDPGNEEGQE